MAEDLQDAIVVVDDPDSGVGGEVSFGQAKEIRLFRRAITQRWDIPAKRREAYMKALDRVVTESEDDRAVVAAVSTLVAADRANIAAYQAVQREEASPANHLHLHAGPSEMFKELIQTIQTRDAVQPARTDNAAAEPAVNDQ